MTVETAAAKVAIIDAETTGLDPDLGHEAWEWGLILREPDTDQVECLWQVRPNLSCADPNSLRIGGYYRRGLLHDAQPGAACTVVGPDVAKVSTAAELARGLAPLLDGAVVVGCNPSFDRDFLKPFLRAYGQAYTCHYRPVCVTTLAAGFIFGKRAGYGIGWNELAYEMKHVAKHRPNWPLNPKIFDNGAGHSLVPLPELPWSSHDVANSVGVDPGDFERHTALDDCRFAAAQLDAVMGRPA